MFQFFGVNYMVSGYFACGFRQCAGVPEKPLTFSDGRTFGSTQQKSGSPLQPSYLAWTLRPYIGGHLEPLE